MAKCTVEPKLDFDKFKEACERFKKICEREMGDACMDDEVHPVIPEGINIVSKTKNDEMIILRPNTFMKDEDFEITKVVWENQIPNSVVIPHSMDVINSTREWIPTSLCLPQRDRPVLVAVKTKNRLPKWIEKQTYHYVTDIDVYVDNVYDNNGWMDNGKNVVAWQPLPAPYKGE